MRRLDLGALACACYALTGSCDEWLTGIVHELGPLMDEGLGIAAWPFRCGIWSDEALPVGVDPDIGRAMRKTGAAQTADTAIRFFLGARAKSTTERMSSSMGLDEYPQFWELKEVGIRDFRALTLPDASGEGIAFAAPVGRVVKTTRATRHRLERVGAHVLAGFRLRRALSEVEAVLGPDGKLLDAPHTEAQAPENRDALRHAVKALDRASCSRRGDDTDDALEAWQGLVSGRWSLVQSFDSDGRRYVLARRNPPNADAHELISPIEAHALVLRAQGGGYKLVAYELGISAAAAHQLVRSGMRKLGVKHDTELPRLFGATDAPSE